MCSLSFLYWASYLWKTNHCKLKKCKKIVLRLLFWIKEGRWQVFDVLPCNFLTGTNDCVFISETKYINISCLGLFFRIVMCNTVSVKVFFYSSPGSVSVQTLVSEERCSPPPAHCSPAADEPPAPCTLWCHHAADHAVALPALNSEIKNHSLKRKTLWLCKLHPYKCPDTVREMRIRVSACFKYHWVKTLAGKSNDGRSTWPTYCSMLQRQRPGGGHPLCHSQRTITSSFLLVPLQSF